MTGRGDGESGVLPVRLDGVTLLPAGHVATIKTYLECARPPPGPAPAPPPGVALARLRGGEAARYARIFRTLGERWLWWSRIDMPEAALAALLDDPAIEAYAVTREGRDIGLLEWDFREADAPELAFLGLYEGETGQRFGACLVALTLARMWREPIRAVRVNTCTLDSPQALGFYRSCGFVIVRQAIEIVPDPRLSGRLSESSAPHVPIMRPV